ncbi:MAG: hypothetical protein NC898_03560 [Candidatus Omnitrophica bacterium]|nr:hypothetical protein [Candidatus Omnitrophota bacterium]MCM8793529.1 hypothetical protein [Candidatus Omnitrophota bacterium]
MQEDTYKIEKGWKEFLESLAEYEKQFLIKEKEDLLLDTYTQWLRTKEEKYKLQTLNLAFDLETLGVTIDINKLFSADK